MKQPKSKSSNGFNGNGVGKLTLHLRPTGVVLDDNPDPLLQSIESRIETIFGRWYKPTLKVHKESHSRDEIDKWIKGADFVLVDNNLARRFAGFSSGLEIGHYIKKSHEDLPVILYTGVSDDLEKPGLREEFIEFKELPNVEYYAKRELTPERKLDELCRKLAFSYKSDLSSDPQDSERNAELQSLLEAQVVSIRQIRYRLIEFDMRKRYQVLRCISEPGMGEIEVLTRQLPSSEPRGNTRDILLKILEFSGGQVLSYMVKAPLKKSDLAKEIISLLENDN